MFSAFLLKKSDRSIIDAVSSDDKVGRQTIITKDGAQYGFDTDSLLLIIEGSEDALRIASGIIGGKGKELDREKTEKIMKEIKEEEDRADQGMGFLFG
ncbi:MAG: hypothetical protein M1454_02620 [Candidatus Thermoplasmatota archaeon]|nr:hypothetical protein [Candidatus Thermoplasmatota archaeon]MCL5731119.1 hypothetical protein [Candidatus Thermoplasmatota archaeon]